MLIIECDNRQREGENTATFRVILDPDFAAMRFGDKAAERQIQTCGAPFPMSTLHLHVTIILTGFVLRRNTRPLINYLVTLEVGSVKAKILPPSGLSSIQI